MMLRLATLSGIALAAGLAVAPAHAMTMKECSAKYQAAKDAGKLSGLSWNDFRKSECSADAPAKATDAKAGTDKKPAIKVEPPATNLSMKECGAKYQEAKKDKTLGSMNWNAFRKAKCGAGSADDETAPATDEVQYNGEPETPTTTAPGGVKFPKAIAAKYSSESPGKGRLHTCLDQYYADKDSNGLGGLKWIQKGGGYYSLCNAKLKG
jgi:hypothetical protein